MTQTESLMRIERPRGKETANQIALDVDRKVRDSIASIGTAMPEKLPTPDENIHQLRARKLTEKPPAPKLLDEPGE